MATIAQYSRTFSPPPPQTIEELGVPQALVMDLMLRRLLLEGNSTLALLGQKLRVSNAVLETVFRHMRHQQLVEVKGMVGNDYQFVLSASGRALAGERFQISQYAGACPVSLSDYTTATKAQSAKVTITRRMLRQALSDLVVTDRLLDSLGPALISQSSMFLYGPTGNGKTSLAERLLRVYNDAVLIPYAVEVDNQIISLYDPVVHERVEDVEEPEWDPRWVLCHRPFILVGGEKV
ncbi:MAG: AAA family ATPase, partial [Acidobacteria bacterium]|nr:AAA family ATPase [Acidobacteriota bacterium]